MSNDPTPLNEYLPLKKSCLGLGATGLTWGFFLFGWLGVFADEAPSEEGWFASSRIAGEKLTGQNHPSGSQSAEEFSAAWLERRHLPWSHWYWGFGLCADTYTFHEAGNFSPHRLQDVAAEFSLEYYIQSEAVLSVTVRPGFYFENHPSSGAWDIPVETISGVPLTNTLSCAIGLLDARFYRRLVPVAGLVWVPNKQVRVEAVFPEPAIIFAVNRKLELRLAGELGGAGFRLDPQSAHHSVEYSTYRVGVAAGYQLFPRWKVMCGAGYEIERTFDFLDDGTRYRARGAPYFKLTISFAR